MRVRRRSKILHWEFEFPLNTVSFHLILFNSQFSHGIPVPFALVLKVLEFWPNGGRISLITLGS